MMLYVFGEYILDTHRRELRRAGVPVKLEPKAYQILTYLVQHRSRLVTKAELLDQVWPDVYVADTAVARCLTAIRQAVGDSGATQRVIQTRHRQGYRFVAPVSEQDVVAPVADAPGERPALATPPAPSLSLPVLATISVASHQDSRSMSFPSAGRSHGERKLVTLLYAALPPALGRGLDLDALYERLHEVDAFIRRTVEPYGGVLQHLTPDQAMVLFGAPTAYEDHAQRAVLAACALGQQWPVHATARWQASATEAALGMGVHTGLVVVETSGNSPVLPATVVGDVPTIAAALAQRARPDTVLVSAATARLVETVGHLEAFPPLEVAGQPAAVAVYRLVALRPPPSGQAQRGERSWSPFTGRAEELALLHSRWAQAQQGYGQVVAIVGEPGIGKTRLLQEFRQHLAAQAVPYLTGSCQSYGSATPYGPLLDLLRQQCGLTVTDDPAECRTKVAAWLQALGLALEDGAPFLLDLVGVPRPHEQAAALSPQARKVRTFAALHQLFLEGSRQQPVILAIDNLHWMDATSTDYLTELVERLGRVPLLLLLSYRPEYQPPWRTPSYATQIALTPLSHADSHRVLRAALGRTPLQAAVQQQLLAKAGGNPLFLEELARVVQEQGEGVEARRVPDTIQAVLAARIDRLPAGAKRLLQTAAIIGTDVPVRLLQAVVALPDEALQAHLQHVQAAELLYETRLLPERTYTFKHVLTQEVAYASLVRRVQQQLHGQIAEVLTARFPEVVATQPAVLAQHYTAAGLITQAVAYWQRAGQHANDRSAHPEAISHCTTGLELLTTLPATPERSQHAVTLYLTLGAALQMVHGIAAPAVEHAYTQARLLCQQVGETPELSIALFGLFRFYYTRGQFHTARDIADTLLRLAQRAPDPGLAVMAHYAVGVMWFCLGVLPVARQHQEEAAALYTPDQSRAFPRELEPGVACRGYTAWILWLLGYPDQARVCIHEALALAQALPHPFGLVHMRSTAATLYHLCRDVSMVYECAEAAIALATEQGFPLWAAAGRCFHGWTLAVRGQGEEGMAQIRQNITAWRATGATAVIVPYFYTMLAEVADRLGHTEDGLQALAEAHTLVEQHEERWLVAEVYRLRGVLLLRQTGPAPAAAEAWLQRALDVARRQEAKSLELRAAISLARLWQQQGKRTAARQLLGEIYGWFTEGFDTADLQEARALLDARA
jgi:DNA-binding winged helix-turn-helix (wHTH) protein/predicted ATPase/class 3 adenylate cyclase